jgi:hypothetical protein
MTTYAMKIPSSTLRTKVFTLLDAALAVSVYDLGAVPDDADPPYVMMGESEVTPWRTKVDPGTSVTLTINVWTQYKGAKTCEDLMSTISEKLTSSILDLTPDFKAIYQDITFATTFLEEDNKTQHGIMKFKFLIRQK